MSGPDLGAFWSEYKERIGEMLPQGVSALAEVLQEGAARFDFTQEVAGRYVHWKMPDGRVTLAFCIVPDPRDLHVVADVYAHAAQLQPALVGVFVHQWTDGTGNWDAFAIGPRCAMRHCDRVSGSDVVEERGPQLREDIYTLFSCDREFPQPGREVWADLLAGPRDEIDRQLGMLAETRDCHQVVENDLVRWVGSDGQIEAQFFILPDPGHTDAFVSMYKQIREAGCPVSFVFLKSDELRCYDIFRLSARSYLEHHNQVKGRLHLRTKGGEKTLENLRWVPHWASHVGCLQGCLNYLGIETSEAWLYGATGHAFVLNVSPGLCPSGPTDWDTSRFLELGRNLGYEVTGVDHWCPKQDDALTEAQREAWDHVRNSIDEGLPCYGWELDVPEYYVIYGYDETGYYISGAGCDSGAGPVSWQNSGTSEIGVILVSSVRRIEPADVRQTVRQALSYAVDIGRNRCEWTDRTGGLAGYDLWIETMEQGKADRFGLGYNAAVWAESRQFAVEFLREAKQRLGRDSGLLFDRSLAQYETVAQGLRAVSEAYPFTQQCADAVKVDSHAQTALEALKQARDAEATGLDVLEELAARLSI